MRNSIVLKIRFQSRVLPEPKWRIDRKRINVRQEVASLIHHVDCFFAVRNTDMHVQSENEIGPRDLLHVFHDRGVAFINRDRLVHPV